MRKPLVFLSVFLSVIILGGCASIPDMTEEQEEMVAEYSAALMLKYDSENHSRLVDVDDFLEEYNMKKQAYEDSAKQYLEEQQKLEEEARKEEEERKEETVKQEEINSGNSGNNDSGRDDTAVVIDNTQTTSSNESIDSYIGTTGFSIDYYGITMNKELADNVFASKGRDFLVVYFDVTNNTSDSKLFDVCTKDVKFYFSINNTSYVSAVINMAEDDLAQAQLTFSGLEKKRLFLALEVPEGTIVNSLTLKAQIDDKNPIIKILK